MVSFADMFEAAWGKWITPGVPSSGKKNPPKNGIVPIGKALDDAITAAASGQRLAETWLALDAANGIAALQPARVTGPDNTDYDGGGAGTHTDPVVGGTVPNTGEFRWNVSPAGWKRIGSTPSLSIIQASTGVSDAAKPIGTDAGGKIDLSFYGATFDQASDQGPISGHSGDGLRTVQGAWADGTFNNPDFNIVKDFAKRPAFRRMAYFVGDSRDDMVSDEVSGMTRTRVKSWFWWLQTALRDRLDFYNNSQNLGIGGSESPTMLANTLSLIGAEPGFVFFFCGINDINAGVNSRKVFENLLVNVRLATEVGGHIAVVFCDTPWGDGNSQTHSSDLSSTEAQHLFNYAQRIRRMGGMRNVIVADPWPYLSNGVDHKALNTMYYDGGHAGPRGGRATGLSAYPQLDAILPERNLLAVTAGDTYTSVNISGSLIGNSLMTGSVAPGVAGITGFLATGWSATIGAGTMAAILSKVPASDGGAGWQQAVLSGTPSGTMTSGPPVDPTPTALVLKYDINTSNLTFGDVLDAGVEIEFDTGSSGIRGIPLYLSVTVDGVVYTVCSGEPETAADSSFPNLTMPADELKGILRTPRMTIPAGTTINAASIQLMICGRTPTAMTGTIRWRLPTPRKVI